jgi:hypothetical protein
MKSLCAIRAVLNPRVSLNAAYSKLLCLPNGVPTLGVRRCGLPGESRAGEETDSHALSREL